jgi:WD40 repeat protein
LKISSLFWADDKSGNFVSSNESFGALTIWNAASEAPQKTIKLGCAGVHSMLPIVGQQRVVTAHKDGAISVFNVSTSRTEFSTESGHSETIFDLDYHPNEPNLLASCSYDGTIRVWDTSQNKLIAINDTNRQKQQA